MPYIINPDTSAVVNPAEIFGKRDASRLLKACTHIFHNWLPSGEYKGCYQSPSRPTLGDVRKTTDISQEGSLITAYKAAMTASQEMGRKSRQAVPYCLRYRSPPWSLSEMAWRLLWRSVDHLPAQRAYRSYLLHVDVSAKTNTLFRECWSFFIFILYLSLYSKVLKSPAFLILFFYIPHIR